MTTAKNSNTAGNKKTGAKKPQAQPARPQTDPKPPKGPGPSLFIPPADFSVDTQEKQPSQKPPQGLAGTGIAADPDSPRSLRQSGQPATAQPAQKEPQAQKPQEFAPFSWTEDIDQQTVPEKNDADFYGNPVERDVPAGKTGRMFLQNEERVFARLQSDKWLYAALLYYAGDSNGATDLNDFVAAYTRRGKPLPPGDIDTHYAHSIENAIAEIPFPEPVVLYRLIELDGADYDREVAHYRSMAGSRRKLRRGTFQSYSIDFNEAWRSGYGASHEYIPGTYEVDFSKVRKPLAFRYKTRYGLVVPARVTTDPAELEVITPFRAEQRVLSVGYEKPDFLGKGESPITVIDLIDF